jgi:hypothetical protein
LNEDLKRHIVASSSSFGLGVRIGVNSPTINRKPFDLKEMLEWLDDCAIKIDIERKLFNWNRNKKID